MRRSWTCHFGQEEGVVIQNKQSIAIAAVIAKGFDCFIDQGYLPVFLALALPDSEDAVLKINIINM